MLDKSQLYMHPRKRRDIDKPAARSQLPALAEAFTDEFYLWVQSEHIDGQ